MQKIVYSNMQGSASVYVYNWTDGDIPMAGAMDYEGRRVMLKITNFTPLFYVVYRHSTYKELKKSRLIKEMQVKHDVPISSNGMFKRDYIEVVFNRLSDYNKELWQCKNRYKTDVYAYEDPFMAFLCKYKLDVCGPYNVYGKLEQGVKYLTVLAKIEDCKMEDIDNIPAPNILCFDIECEHAPLCFSDATNFRDNILCIGITIRGKIDLSMVYTIKEHRRIDGVTIVKFDDEVTMIREFLSLIDEYEISCVTCYNGMGFDLNFIRARLGMYLENTIEGLDIEQFIAPNKMFKKRVVANIVHPLCIVLDVYEFIKDDNKLEDKSLDGVSKRYLNATKDGDFVTKYEAYRKTGDYSHISSIIKYCQQDVNLTIRLFEHLSIWNQGMELARQQMCYPKLYFVTGHSMKSCNLLMRESIWRDYILDTNRDPPKEAKYTGAFNLAESGVFWEVSLLDYTSHYPKIIIAYNICESTLVREDEECEKEVLKIIEEDGEEKNICFRTHPQGLLAGIMNRLVNKRAEVTELNKEANNPILASRAYALKIAANAFYGALGAKDVRQIYSRECALAVTSYGVHLMKFAIEKTREKYKKLTVYGDTDSIMVVHGTDASKGEINEFAKSLNKDIAKEYRRCFSIPNLSLKFIYDKIIIMKKKKYITLRNGKIEYLGCDALKKDKCKFVKEKYMELASAIMNEKNIDEISRIIELIFKELIYNKVGIDKLLMYYKSTADYSSIKAETATKILCRRLTLSGMEIDPISRIPVLCLIPYNEDYSNKNRSMYLYALCEYDSVKYRICYEEYILHRLIPPFFSLLKAAGINIDMYEIYDSLI